MIWLILIYGLLLLIPCTLAKGVIEDMPSLRKECSACKAELRDLDACVEQQRCKLKRLQQGEL